MCLNVPVQHLQAVLALGVEVTVEGEFKFVTLPL